MSEASRVGYEMGRAVRELRERAEAAEREAKQQSDLFVTANGQVLKANRLIKELKATLARVREEHRKELLVYGSHKHSCRSHGFGTCDCGYEALLNRERER